MRLHHTWLIMLGLLMGCGSGSDLERIVVSGTVSYQGRPVEDGCIRFVPIQGTKGPSASALIKNGSYTVKAGGGVPAGAHRVEISDLGGNSPAELLSGPGGPPAAPGGRRQSIPRKYNRDSVLEVTIESGGPQTKNYDLQ